MNLDNTEVIILAGGQGSRIKSEYPDLPKTLIPINKTPFLTCILSNLKKNKISNICIATGVLSEKVKDYIETCPVEFSSLRMSDESSPLGTGGALKKAIESSKFKNFLVLNGDTYFDIDYEKFLSSHEEVLSMALSEMKNTKGFSSVQIDSKRKVTGFNLNIKDDLVLQNAGSYSCTSMILDHIKDSKVSLENDVFPELIKKGLISSQTFKNSFYDIGTPEGLEATRSLLDKLL